MFDRSCCPDRAHLTEAPFVSAGALGALSAVLDMASKALRASSNPLLFGASNLPHDQNRGECDATEDSDAVPRMSAGFASDTQRDLFGANPPDSVGSAPAWPELPVEAQVALTKLMVQLMLQHAAKIPAPTEREAGRDV